MNFEIEGLKDLMESVEELNYLHIDFDFEAYNLFASNLFPRKDDNKKKTYSFNKNHFTCPRKRVCSGTL
jgi:hypothetical protein